MKITENLVKTGVKLAIAGIAISWLYKTIKKEKKRMDLEYSEFSKKCEKIGLDLEQIQKENKNNKNSRSIPITLSTFIKFKRCLENKIDLIDPSLLDIDEIMETDMISEKGVYSPRCDYRNFIHIFSEKNRNGEDWVYFYIGIPSYDRKTPTAKHYIDKIRLEIENLYKELRPEGVEKLPAVWKEGYYSYIDKKTEIESDSDEKYNPEVFIQIPEEMYREFDDKERGDGLQRMMSHYHGNKKERLKNTDWESLSLYAVVGIPVYNEDRDIKSGSTELTIIEIMEMLQTLANMEIMGNLPEQKVQKIEKIVFHPDERFGYYYGNDYSEYFLAKEIEE